MVLHQQGRHSTAPFGIGEAAAMRCGAWRQVQRRRRAAAAASSTTAGGGLTSLAEQKGGIHTPMHTQTVVFRSKKVGTAAAAV